MHQCDDCGHSFYVPGTNLPLVIEGGCPECGGNSRPEPDQPSPVNSDGDLRNMVDPYTGDDTGGNPLQEGILGETDGGWQNRQKRDESFASVRAAGSDYWQRFPNYNAGAHCSCGGQICGPFEHEYPPYACMTCGKRHNNDELALRKLPEASDDVPRTTGEADPFWDEFWHSARQSAHGLIPCPDCGGDIRAGASQDFNGEWQQVYRCTGCGRQWGEHEVQQLVPGHGPCPHCGSEATGPYNFSPLYGPDASRCYDCHRAWSAGDAAPDTLPEDWDHTGSFNELFTPSLVPGRSGYDQCPRCERLIGTHERLLSDEGCPQCGFNYPRDTPRPGPTQQVYPQTHKPPTHPVTGEPVTSPYHVPPASNDLMNMIPRQGSQEYVTVMRNHPVASNQTPQLPWQFEVEEVAEPGMDNEDAEAKINGQEKKAFLPALALGAEALLGGGAAAEGAAGAAGAAGGGGLGMGLLRRAVPSLMGSAVGNQVGGGNGSGVADQAVDESQPRPMEMIASDLPGGGTPNEFPKDTEDPEKVDPKEHNDQDNTHFQNDLSVNGLGGTDDATPTPGLEALQMLLPLVVHYAESPESGMDHPLVSALHGLLDGEGLMHGPQDPQAVIEVIRHVKGDGGHEDTSSELPKTEDTQEADRSDDGQENDDGNSSKESAIQFPPCPNCGQMAGFENYPFASGFLWCKKCQHIISPQDLGKLLNDMKATHDAEISSLPEVEPPNGHAGANDQAPHNPEQIAAVQQYLRDNGREDLVEQVLLDPLNPMWGDILAEVAQKQPPPQDVTQPQPAQEDAGGHHAHARDDRSSPGPVRHAHVVRPVARSHHRRSRCHPGRSCGRPGTAGGPPPGAGLLRSVADR
jgi:predicted  nucleic acid-binding Zn-ribbon protein